MVADVEAGRAWGAQAEEGITEHAEDEGFDTRTAPGEVARDFMHIHSEPVLTLRNAIVTTGGSPPAKLGVLRLQTAHIAGCWLLPGRDETGGIHIKHPPDPPEDFPPDMSQDDGS